jgi:hypothetical protein
MAGKRIFISYSSPDVDKANLIREAIEAAGVTCWIAPRDLEAGNQWGGSIVQAIQACEAVVVVFSEAANRSPQVAREMELSVSNRKQLIPIRVANDMPTDDMQYFLGVSHWFNAFAKPLAAYLPEIVASVKNVLAKENNPWANAMRRMPKTRNGQMLLVVGVVILAVILLATFLKPPSLASLAKMEENPLTGRWEAKIKDATGKTSDCILDLPKGSVMATFSDACPDWLAGSSGMMSAQKGMGVMAPDVYKSGDTGSFNYNNQAGGMLAGAFKFGLFGGMTTRDNHFGEIKWKKISDSKPLPKATDGVLPASLTWPVQGVPGLADKVTHFVRTKWASDAVLMSLGMKPGASGGVDVSFDYYSPSNQQVRSFQSSGQGSALTKASPSRQDTRASVPAQFLDLTAAIDRAHQTGMQGKQITGAELSWTNGGCGTGNFAIDNAILPRCPPGNFEGVQWQLDSAIGERRFIPATQ